MLLVKITCIWKRAWVGTAYQGDLYVLTQNSRCFLHSIKEITRACFPNIENGELWSISGDGRCWDAALSYYFKCPALLTAGASHTSNPLDHFSVCIVLKVLAGLGEAKSLTFSLRAGIWFPVSLALSDLWKGFITV